MGGLFWTNCVVFPATYALPGGSKLHKNFGSIGRDMKMLFCSPKKPFGFLGGAKQLFGSPFGGAKKLRNCWGGNSTKFPKIYISMFEFIVIK